MPPDHDAVRYEEDARVATITIDSPPLNILTWALRSQILAAVRRAFDSPSVRAVCLISGLPAAFSAGADIGEFRDSLRPGGGRERCTVEHQTYDEIEFGPKPVLCGIHGYCLGGGLELAMASDLRIAAADAVFGQPEIGLGCFPGGGGTERLALLVGRSRAKELLWTGRQFSAADARRWGLVTEVVDRAELPTAVRTLAAQITAQSPRAVLAIKTLVDEATGVRRAIAGALPSVAPWVEEMYTSDPVRIALAEFEERRAARRRASGAGSAAAEGGSAS
jgi:enoyl-CoA hydratase/carnithine racemase